MGPCGFTSHVSPSWVELGFPLSPRKTAWNLRGTMLGDDCEREQVRASTPDANRNRRWEGFLKKKQGRNT